MTHRFIRLGLPAIVLAATSLFAQEAPPPPPAPEAPPAPPVAEDGPKPIEQARALFKAGDYTAASEAAARAIADNPQSAEARYIAGASAAKLGRHDEAEPHLRAVVAVRDDYPNAHYWLGYVTYFRADSAVKQGDVEVGKGLFLEAAKEFQKELARLPTHGGALSSRALALLKGGALEEAIAAHEAWIAAAPQKNEAYASLGSVYAQLGRGADATAILERLPDKDPANTARIALQMAIDFHGIRRYDDCLALATKALELDPKLLRALTVITVAHAQLGQFDEVAADFLRLIALNASPEDVDQAAGEVKKVFAPGALGADIVHPEVLRIPEPRYPKLARDSQMATTVEVMVNILQDGRVGTVVAVPNRQSLDHRTKGFEDAAFEAVKKGRFKPGTRAGAPADLWQIVAVKFTP